MSATRQATWILGDQCNARCAHCPTTTAHRSRRSLGITWDEAQHIFEELCGAGVQELTLGGNEPIFTHGLRPEASMLPDILREARARGLRTCVQTNGTTALLLAGHDPEAFAMVDAWEVSVDSAFPVEHDASRGGAFFALAERALQRIQAAGAELRLVCCLMDGNTSPRHLAALVALARRYGARLGLQRLQPTAPGHVALLPTPAAVAAAFQATEGALSSCACGPRSFTICPVTPDGRVPVASCRLRPEHAHGDLLQQPLLELLQELARQPRPCESLPRRTRAPDARPAPP